MLEFLRSITAPGFVKTGGTSSQFLKADGSVDSSVYAKTDGTGASGNWGISITGNAATVGGLSKSQLFNNSGNGHAAYSDFNSPTDFGAQYIQGVIANSPGIPNASQYYVLALGIGSYSYNDYAMQMAIPRASIGGLPYLSVRYKEGGGWTAWYKINAGYAEGSTSTFTVNTAALSTSATTGFLWIPSCPGAPTGAPTAPYTNAAALVVDTTNSRLYVLVGSTWKYASLT